MAPVTRSRANNAAAAEVDDAQPVGRRRGRRPTTGQIRWDDQAWEDRSETRAQALQSTMGFICGTVLVLMVAVVAVMVLRGRFDLKMAQATAAQAHRVPLTGSIEMESINISRNPLNTIVEV